MGMKCLPIKRTLSEETRIQTVILAPNHVYDLHKDNNGDYCITEHGSYENVVMVVTKELWQAMFE
jgi:hypothetical protein